MSFTFKQYPRIAIIVILVAIVSACEQSRLPDVGEHSREPLILHSSLSTRINIVPNLSTARNVILFIGDGMGVTTVTAARIFDGQSKGMSGEENVLPFETFPNVALIKTYTANQMVADSAGSASAMNTGVKTRAGVIGIGPQAYRRSCEGALAYPLTTLGELAEQNGKATGIVTTARITHATPAAVYGIRQSVTGRAIASCLRQTGRWAVEISPTSSHISLAVTASRSCSAVVGVNSMVATSVAFV